MPLAAFTFGSLGDIIAVIQLANQIRAALNEASGASSEIRTLVADFDRFTLVLEQVKAVLTAPQPTLQPAMRAEIDAALGGCEAVLLSTQRLIRGFEARIVRRDGRSAWRAYWAALAWEILGGRRQVDVLRTRLAESVRVITTYLLVAQSREQSALREAADSHRASLLQVRDAVEGIPRYFGADTPGFMFYDEKTDAYYQPCARTSAHRCGSILEPFLTLYQAGTSWHVSDIDRWLDRLGEPDFTGRYKNGFRKKIWLQVAKKPEVYISCFFFMSSFGEVHVLVGVPPVKDSDSPDVRPRLLHALLNRLELTSNPRNSEGTWIRDHCQRERARAHVVTEVAMIYNNFVNQFLPLEEDEKIQTTRLFIEALRAYPDHNFLKQFCDEMTRLSAAQPAAENTGTQVTGPQEGLAQSPVDRRVELREALLALLRKAPKLERSVVMHCDLDKNLHIGPTDISITLLSVAVGSIDIMLWLHPLFEQIGCDHEHILGSSSPTS